MELNDRAQLGLGTGQACVMGAPTDPIVRGATPLAPLHDWGPNPYGGMLPELSAVNDIATGIVESVGILLAAAQESPRREGRSVLTQITSHPKKRPQTRR